MKKKKCRPILYMISIACVIGIRYNKLRKLKIAEKVDTACRSLVE